jgi:UDPglucose--hexose-1-phosphate uridylyltransferase
MHKLVLQKPDGRPLILYGRKPITNVLEAPVPRGLPSGPNPHLRWHPLRGEWVDYAAYRQERTFLPPAEFNPLAPATSPEQPTELPAGDYDVAVFQNSFPSLTQDAHEASSSIVETRPANGVCEVVVYTQNPKTSLGDLPLSQIELILEVWADRYHELSSQPGIRYIMPFENRGVEVGVTLHHPHGQIYAYPFVPPIAARELEQQRKYFEQKGKAMLEDLIAEELRDGRRILFNGESTVAFVPAFARYAYEVWIAPKICKASLADFNEAQRADFACALKTVLLKYDGLWNRPFPYVMILHQAPVGSSPHESHFHIEFYPPYRSAAKLKFLAGSELGAGMFTSDTLPEEKAAELQAVNVEI